MYYMKKIFSFTLWLLAIWLFSFAVVSADLDEKKLTELFEWSALFGYDDTHKVTVNSITNSSITLSSPVLESDLGEKIDDYVVLYGKHSFDELLNDPELLKNFTEVAYSSNDSQNEFTMKLENFSSSDTSSIFYVVVIPRDNWNILWNMSNEICFILKDKVSGEWQECANWTTSSSKAHTASSWSSAINLANVSCTWNGKTVTLSWQPTSDLWNVKISLYNESVNPARFDIKGTVNANSQRTFSFNVTQNTEPIIRFDNTEWLNAYKDYTCHRLSTSTPETTPTTGTAWKVTTVPRVWPKENALAVVIWAFVLYIVYSVVRRKAN